MIKQKEEVDELVKAAQNWINEEAKHKNYSQFARGYVYFKYLGSGYSADVVVGINNDGVATLYDLVNIQDKNITELPLQRREENSLYRNGNSVLGTDITTPSSESQSPKSTKALMTTDRIDYLIEDSGAGIYIV